MKNIAFFVFFCACNSTVTTKSNETTDTIKVKLNESFSIRLPTTMGTGYSWTLADSSYTRNLSLDSVTVINTTKTRDDTTDIQVFHFRALVKSTTLLHFIHKRPWEKADKADKEKKFTVIIG